MQAVQRAPGSVPTESPLDGGERRYILSERLLHNTPGAGATAAVAAPFRVWIPTTRLLTIVTLGFLPDVGEDATIPAGITWTMDAWSRLDRPYGGRAIRGNQIVPGPFALPNGFPASYEAVTGVREWRGVVTVPVGGSGIAVAGDLVVTATWEPAAGASGLDDVVLKRLFDSCKVQGGSGATVFQTA